MRLAAIALFALCVSVVAPAAANAQISTSAPFRASALNFQELRALQAALTVSRNYDGLLDGDWGPGSRGALERWASDNRIGGVLSFADLRPLLVAYQRLLDIGGWRNVYYRPTNTYFAFPFNLMDPAPVERGEIGWETRDRGLLLLTDVSDFATTEASHDQVLVQAAPGTTPYDPELEDARIITGVTLPDRGGSLYVYSFPTGENLFGTTALRADSRYEIPLALIIASLSAEDRGSIGIPEGRLLAAVRDGLARPTGRVQVSSTDGPTVELDPPIREGGGETENAPGADEPPVEIDAGEAAPGPAIVEP